MKRLTIKASKLVRLINNVIDACVFATLLCLLLYAFYALWDSQQVYSAASTKQFLQYKPTPDSVASFEEIRALNDDVVAWLTIDGTGIDYPVVQGESNTDYLQKDPLLNVTASGSLFLDYQNSSLFSDSVSIIYGHHMENSLMFGDLDCFLDKEFFDSHKYGSLYFSGKWHKIAFIAFVLASSYDTYLYTPNNRDSSYINYILNIATNKRAVEKEGNLILLSTCARNITNGRFVLVGVICD